MLFAGTTSESYLSAMTGRGGEGLKYSSEASSLPRHLDGITLAMPSALISYSRSPIATRIKGLDKPFPAVPLPRSFPLSSLLRPSTFPPGLFRSFPRFPIIRRGEKRADYFGARKAIRVSRASTAKRVMALPLFLAIIDRPIADESPARDTRLHLVKYLRQARGYVRGNS